ncbi:MAG: hypothetical protein CUR33_16140 [Pseudomonas sp.]|nr:MAG: hypothetical protein CUR33_16140 [Pseudomonas sp.] [Pseudomonas sp. FEMGT703P]
MLDAADEILRNEVKDLRDGLWKEAADRKITLYRTFAVREAPNRLRVDWQKMKHYTANGVACVAFERLTLNNSSKNRKSYKQSTTAFGRVDSFHSLVLTRLDPLLMIIREKADLIGDARVIITKLEYLAKAT